MATIGGPLESVALAGRLFAVAADAEAERKLGGKEIEAQANGNGTARYVATVVPWKISGVSLELDDTRLDQEFLQEKVDAMVPIPCEFTFVDGTTYRGEGLVTGEVIKNAMNATSALTFEGGGKLEQ